MTLNIKFKRSIAVIFVFIFSLGFTWLVLNHSIMLRSIEPDASAPSGTTTQAFKVLKAKPIVRFTKQKNMLSGFTFTAGTNAAFSREP
jgi:hypothetical protein